ncbi:MAG: KDO2-lipid IV(A) lauroyltransferase, partial [Candidatus Krumholzibacteriia bacterium]
MSWHNRAEYIAFRIAVGGLKVMPDQWSVNVCRAMAYLAGPVFGLRKRTVVDQLSAIFQDQSADDIEKLMKAVYDHLGRSVSETFCVSEDALIKSVAVTPGWGGLDKAVSGGGGAIVVTAHMGNFELGGRALAQRYSVLDVIKPMRNPIFGKYLDRERSRHGIATVPMDDSGRAVLQHLRDGGVVTLLLDQDAGKDGVRIDFLGR